MKFPMSSFLVLSISIGACAQAPIKPSNLRGGVNTSAADAEGQHEDDHDHAMEGMESQGGAPANTVSTPATMSDRAGDLELIQGWSKGQYLGNETLKVTYLPLVPLQ
jgi:hypothetical protein